MKRLLVNLSIWFFALNALLIGGELSTLIQLDSHFAVIIL
jgi:hypothetical protein